eukprot:GHVN01059458.1.p1 GENE.GHVN01059458.1~~GHVN01059458.1.p1  ORF type:complete len:993 (-),score=127.14 GHVN01059458.1:1816-4641(-)
MLTKMFNKLVPLQFLNLLVEQVGNQSENSDVERFFGRIIDNCSEGMKGRTLIDPKWNHLRMLHQLIQVPRLALLTTQRPAFLPLSISRFVPRNGYALQTQSTLGHMLSPTPLTDPIAEMRAKALRAAGSQGGGQPEAMMSVRERYFPTMSRSTQQHVSQSTSTVRQGISQMMENANDMLKLMIKAERAAAKASPQSSSPTPGSPAITQTKWLRVMKWMADVVSSNEMKSSLLQHHNVGAMLDLPVEAQQGHLARTGMVSSGFSLSVFWALLDLCEPIKLEKVSDLIDTTYCCRNDIEPLMGSVVKEAHMGSDEQQSKVKEYTSQSAVHQSPASFTTEVFWVTVKAFKTLYRPALQEYVAIIDKLQNQPQGHMRDDPQADRLAAELGCWQIVLNHPQFLKSLWHSVHLFWTVLLRAAYLYQSDGSIDLDVQASIVNNQGRVSHLVAERCTPKSDPHPSPQFCSIPASLVDEVQEAVSLLIQLPRSFTGQGGDQISAMDAELMLAVCVFITANENFVRNPHTRCLRAAQLLSIVDQIGGPLKGRLEFSLTTSKHLISSIIALFIDVQKADYHSRIEMRNNLMHQLDMLLSVPCFQQRMSEYSTLEAEKFLRFIHLLLGESAWLLEEGMSFLSEIKKRELENPSSIGRSPGQTANNAQPPLAQAATQSAATEATSRQEERDAEVNELNATVEQMPMERLQSVCQSLMIAGLRAVQLMLTITKTTGKVIANSPLITPQYITTLNCCLYHLVGPRWMQLKVTSFEAYSFKPKELLTCIALIFLALRDAAKPSRQVITECIVNEDRYFSRQTFANAAKIIHRESLLDGIASTDPAVTSATHQFAQLAEEVDEAAKKAEEEADFLTQLEDEIPDNFKCELLNSVMTDPVKLPSSGKIVDRKSIERHLLSEEIDPYSRSVLTKDELIPLADLKREIDLKVKELREKRSK